MRGLAGFVLCGDCNQLRIRHVIVVSESRGRCPNFTRSKLRERNFSIAATLRPQSTPLRDGRD